MIANPPNDKAAKSRILISLDFAGRQVLIVGGGHVAERKALLFVEHDVTPWIVAPEVTDVLSRLIDDRKCSWSPRVFEKHDLDGVFLVIAATNSSEVNDRIERLAEKRGCLVNRTDAMDPDVMVPSLVERGDLTIGISTCGASPHFARYMRKKVEEWVDDTYGDYVALMRGVRTLAFERGIDPGMRRKAFVGIDDEAYIQRLRNGENLTSEQVLSELLSQR